MDIDSDLIAQLQGENDQLKLQVTDLQEQVDKLEDKLKNLPVVTSFQQITTIGQSISDDSRRIRDNVALILKLSTII